MIILGGILLTLPGFITDVIGALLLLGPVRNWCVVAFRRVVVRREQPKEGVVDLDAGEWQELADRELEKPRGNSERR